MHLSCIALRTYRLQYPQVWLLLKCCGCWFLYCAQRAFWCKSGVWLKLMIGNCTTRGQPSGGLTGHAPHKTQATHTLFDSTPILLYSLHLTTSFLNYRLSVIQEIKLPRCYWRWPAVKTSAIPLQCTLILSASTQTAQRLHQLDVAIPPPMSLPRIRLWHFQLHTGLRTVILKAKRRLTLPTIMIPTTSPPASRPRLILARFALIAHINEMDAVQAASARSHV